MKILSKSLEDTEKIAKDFLEKLALSSFEEATIVGLYGDLGSGKTTFTQAIAKIFGIKEDITSPTFVIEKIYSLENPFYHNLIHIDTYRLESTKEMNALGWENISKNPHNIIFLEWPERVLGVLPENHLKINFKFVSESEREIEI
jgi:tRNA threonylcarbamoyladenosine biosynthesis protein TsaE